MSQRKRSVLASRKARLEAAGYEFEQIPEGKKNSGKWRVWLPVKGETHELRLTLGKVYKHLTTAVSAGVRSIEKAKTRKDAYDDLSADWETAIKLFDAYEEKAK